MSKRSNLERLILQKHADACTALVDEGFDPKSFNGTGCVIAAMDGFTRGSMPPEAYRAHLRANARGNFFDVVDTANMVLGLSEDAKEALGNKCPDVEPKFFSASPDFPGVSELEHTSLTPDNALALAQQVRRIRTFGVFIITQLGENTDIGHVSSLIGDGKHIVQIDANRRPLVSLLKLQNTANLLLEAQNNGLVIEAF